MKVEITPELEHWFYDALQNESPVAALTLLKHALNCHKTDQLADELCNLGMSEREAGNHHNALRYFRLSLTICERFQPDDYLIQLRAARNCAEIVQSLEDEEHLQQELDRAFVIVWRLKKLVRSKRLHR